MPKIIQQKEQEQRCFSFYQNTKKRLIDEFQRIQQQYDLNNLVLVLDLTSAAIISGLFSATQLVQYQIMFVERLEVARKVLPYHAIYFITPNQQSIAAMLRDFQNEKQPQYKKAHVLLTGTLEEKMMRDIGKSKGFMKKLAKHSFKQFYCQLSIVSDNCLHMNIHYLQHAFSKQNSKEKEARIIIGKRFVHLAAGYPKLHTVRFLYDNTTANKVAQRMVERSSKEVHQYMMKLLDSKSNAIDPNAPDLTFFVVDRSVDVITPLLHGYSYESLLYDILNQGGKHREEYSKLPKDIFDQFRYRHISHALQELPKRLDSLLQKTSKPGSFDPLQLKKLIDEKQQLNIHVQLLHRLFEKYQQKKLTEIGQIQLSLATGITQDGKQTSSSELVDRIFSQIKNNKIVLSEKERLRLGLLSLICIKLTKQDYMKLLSLFSEEDKKILINLNALGITYDKKIGKSTKNIDKSTMDRSRQLLQERNIPSERFQSALEITLPRLVKLLKKDQKGQQKKMLGEIAVSVSPDKRPPLFDEERLVLFMCGGLSPTEICSIRKDHSLDSILLATDMILTPEDFVNSLAKIDILDN